MSKPTVISLDRPGRLLRKTREYLANLDVFLAETPGSITILLNALPLADPSLAAQILPLLGTTGKDRVLGPLFHVMMDSSAEEEIRRSAAVQLGLAASLSENSLALNSLLIQNLDHPEPLVRSSCALAMGWEGNGGAVDALMSHLQDPDRDVQAAVVAALSSVNDVRVFEHLTERLKNGDPEEQRSIVLNLWRFAERMQGVETVYLKCLDWLSAELFPDILFSVSMIPHTAAILGIYRQMLLEDDPGLCLQVMENLQVLDPLAYQPLNRCLRGLLTNKDYRLRQAATRLLARREKGRSV